MGSLSGVETTEPTTPDSLPPFTSGSTYPRLGRGGDGHGTSWCVQGLRPTPLEYGLWTVQVVDGRWTTGRRPGDEVGQPSKQKKGEGFPYRPEYLSDKEEG